MSTATGLEWAEVRTLPEQDAKVLQEWHVTKAGDDDGQLWYPQAVRRMPRRTRLELAYDPEKDLLWERRERERVVRSPRYFIESYGHVQGEEGPPVPFTFWPRRQQAQENCLGARDQAEVLEHFCSDLRVIVLKARQLGLTWLAVHYAVWLVAFDPKNPRARVLALSKKGDDATKLLARARRICKLLPPYLRPVEDPETSRNLSRFKIRGRGEIASLTGSPEAARGETAALAIMDEFGHIKNQNAGPTWTALQPTLGKKGKAILIFTGNGPAEAPGDGQAAAKLWESATSGKSGFYPIFLPTSVHPGRDRDLVKEEFLSEEEWKQEYAESIEEALAGRQGMKIYPIGGINAAEQLGQEFDVMLERGTLPPPSGDELVVTWDWGNRTHGLILWPLEAGGIYVCPGEVAPEQPQEVKQSTIEMIEHLDHIQRPGSKGYTPPVGETRVDAADYQSLLAYKGIVAERQNLLRFSYRTVNGMPKVYVLRVPFGKFKDASIDYLRRLFNRSASGEAVGVIAISPRNKTLLRQLRGYEVADELTGRARKGDDHGCDSLAAGAAPLAWEFLGRGTPEGSEE